MAKVGLAASLLQSQSRAVPNLGRGNDRNSKVTRAGFIAAGGLGGMYPTSAPASAEAPGLRRRFPRGTAVDGLGGGASNDDLQVESLVDLVNLLRNSDNPLWELVRFEVREAT